MFHGHSSSNEGNNDTAFSSLTLAQKHLCY